MSYTVIVYGQSQNYATKIKFRRKVTERGALSAVLVALENSAVEQEKRKRLPR